MEQKKVIEKIEVSKHNGSFYYTGILEKIDDAWVQIKTTRGEVLKFRKEQIMQRRLIDTNGVDTHDGRKKGNKNL